MRLNNANFNRWLQEDKKREVNPTFGYEISSQEIIGYALEWMLIIYDIEIEQNRNEGTYAIIISSNRKRLRPITWHKSLQEAVFAKVEALSAT